MMSCPCNSYQSVVEWLGSFEFIDSTQNPEQHQTQSQYLRLSCKNVRYVDKSQYVWMSFPVVYL
jgi:hypothetical protein